MVGLSREQIKLLKTAIFHNEYIINLTRRLQCVVLQNSRLLLCFGKPVGRIKIIERIVALTASR